MQDSERGSRAFLGRLLQILADSREPAITRSAAASYVASFLARAAFLSDSVLMEHTAKLASWCLSYCQRHDSLGNGVGYAGQGYVEAPPQGVIHQVSMTEQCPAFLARCYVWLDCRHIWYCVEGRQETSQSAIPEIRCQRTAMNRQVLS